MNPRYAYITIATSKDYLPGLLTMFLSLQHTGTPIPLYAMLPSDLVKDEAKTCSRMKSHGINIIEYNNPISIPQELIDSNDNQGFQRFSHTFDKLLVFEQTQFDKLVFLDADLFILHNLDHLFGKQHMCATTAGKSYPGNGDWIDLNSGIMTIVPEKKLPDQFKKLIPSVVETKKICGDQDILQAYYTEWPHHPELDMGEKYNVFSYYAHYYEHHLGYKYTNDINDPYSVAVIHFAGEKKPWMQQWSILSVLKQELQLLYFRLIHKRNTTTVLLEYKHLVRKARKLLYQ